ncbi:hypothetical protein B277_14543 [Janibacter hoylei PVAS-1]|uniref:Uncharacterized protein n=1 Tax=Janibacter hoylei PVAS-1 TaxID=1210046 RepID=K1E414_9MICO|nr:hypothetical protein [Janibacter hoylei]EKA60127.1 hypothetical protein B277_14543 [Janibacter hoylei PVAS-1]
MSMLIQRVAGALLALVGLVAAVVGAWFLAHLGTSGTATFTAEPGQRVVVLEPDVLNRVDHPVEITATGSGDVWVGTARPSDVEAFFGDAQRAQVAGVDVSDWALTATDQGQGEAIDPAGLDIWQQSSAAKGEITRTVDQADAPQAFVVAAPRGQRDRVGDDDRRGRQLGHDRPRHPRRRPPAARRRHRPARPVRPRRGHPLAGLPHDP